MGSYLGWSANEDLVIITRGGYLYVYSVLGERLREVLLSRTFAEAGESVTRACVWSGGAVVLTDQHQLHAVLHVRTGEPFALAATGLSSAPRAMCVIDPSVSVSKGLEVLLAVDSTIYVVDERTSQDQLLTNGPFDAMAVSPNGKFLACFSSKDPSSGVLWVVSADFNRNKSEYKTGAKVPPTQLVWCGNDAVVMHWQLKQTILVGPDGLWLSYSFGSNSSYLVPEVDSVRVLARKSCELLYRVPRALAAIFRVGSLDPAAMLYEAYEQYEARDARADDIVRSIKDELPNAVNRCIEAAAYEFDPAVQKKLMSAASFGKCFCDFFNADLFVDVARSLRVFNAVRKPEIGIPITYEQFTAIGMEALVRRLMHRHHHLLASRVCDFLGARKNAVLVHWACAKIRHSFGADDAAIEGLIVRRLSSCPGISYAEIARFAFQNNRAKLAARLLDHETRAADQVPLLMSMGEDEGALVKAMQGGDPDLVYLAILHLQEQRSSTAFMKLIATKPLAASLFARYCRSVDPQLLKSFYYTVERTTDAAYESLREAYEQSDIEKKKRLLRVAAQVLLQHRDTQGVGKAVEEQIRLLEVQVQLAKVMEDDKIIGVSVTDTLFMCIVAGEHKTATKLRTDFKIPDKRFWWTKIKALSSLQNWDALEKFSHEKKSPIGYAPFFEVCFDAGAALEARKYISYISSADEKVRALMRCGDFREAADAAASAKNPALLAEVQQRCRNPEIEMYVDELRRKLGL